MFRKKLFKEYSTKRNNIKEGVMKMKAIYFLALMVAAVALLMTAYCASIPNG